MRGGANFNGHTKRGDVGIIHPNRIARVVRGGGIGNDLRDNSRVINAGEHHLGIADEGPPYVDFGHSAHRWRNLRRRGARDVGLQAHRLWLHVTKKACHGRGMRRRIDWGIFDVGATAGQIGEAAAKFVAMSVAQPDRRWRRAVGRRRNGERVVICILRRRASDAEKRRVVDHERAVLPSGKMLRKPGQVVGCMLTLCRRRFDGELIVEVGREDRRGRRRRKVQWRACTGCVDRERPA